MNHRYRFILRLCAVLALMASAFAVKVGDPAPGFTAVDSNGKQQRLSDYKGKFVVLEWHNQGCPYTRKHYESGNMQRLQKEWTAKGVVWLTVISSAPGMQGFVTPSQENDYLKTMKAAPTAVLMDPGGSLGGRLRHCLERGDRSGAGVSARQGREQLQGERPELGRRHRLYPGAARHRPVL